jgi:hypothetical protein
LFVVSGSVAAAAPSGIETTTFALFLALAFLAFEERWKWTFALSLMLACLTRPEGAALAAVLCAMELVRAWRDAPPAAESGRVPPRGSMLAAFVPALAALVALGITRLATVGDLASPWLRTVLHPDEGQWRQGALYVADFLGTSGSSLLLPIALWHLVRGKLSATGVRALALAFAWMLLTILSGGGSLPFFHEMVPILAILFVGLQEGMTVALDSRRIQPQLTWVLFLLALFFSALASKYPGNLGPLPVERLHRVWMRPLAEPALGYEGMIGRLGTTEEIQTTERLRAVGVIVRDQLDPTHSLLTPWPGAIGYLSRLALQDALGRTAPAAGKRRTHSWTGRPRVDVVEALEARPDYILPVSRVGADVPSLEAVAQAWTNELDLMYEDPARRAAVAEALAPYELIVVPEHGPGIRAGLFPGNRFFLLRRRELGLAPRVHVTAGGQSYKVEAEHRSHAQLVDLRLQAVDAQGRAYSVTPSGELVEDPACVARSAILLMPTGERRIELMRGELPVEAGITELRAQLGNPRALGRAAFSIASEPATARLER